MWIRNHCGSIYLSSFHNLDLRLFVHIYIYDLNCKKKKKKSKVTKIILKQKNFKAILPRIIPYINKKIYK